MNIKVVDFQKVTSHYKFFRDGLDEIEKRRQEIIKELGPLQDKMSAIIKEAQSGIKLSNKTDEERAIEFQQLQNQAMSMNTKYDNELKEMNGKLNEETFDQLSEFIKEWASKNNIDIVMSNMEVVFVNDSNDATNDIIQLLIDKDVYVSKEEVVKGETL